MFRGSDSSKVDDKGRWKLPASLAELLGDDKDAPFYITISANRQYGEIWPMAEWQKVEAKLARASSLDEAVTEYQNLVGFYGRQDKLDAAGRFMLPKKLREAVNLEGEVLAVGRGRFMALYNEQAFENEFLPKQGLSAEKKERINALLNGPDVE